MNFVLVNNNFFSCDIFNAQKNVSIELFITKYAIDKKIYNESNFKLNSQNGRRIPVTSENDDFDLWDHNRGLGREE